MANMNAMPVISAARIVLFIPFSSLLWIRFILLI